MSRPCIIMPKAPARPLHVAAPINCPIESIIVNLSRARPALRAALSSMTIRSGIYEGVVSGHIPSSIRHVDVAAGLEGAAADDRVILDKPKFLRAVVRKIRPRAIAV